MARTNVKPVTEAINGLKRGNLLPVYFFFGEDSFAIQNALTTVETAVQPYLASEFDKETFYGDDKSIVDITSAASAFPFGSEKKLVIVKEFEKIKDKKNLTSFINSPPDFTVLVIINNGTITNLTSEPYASLAKNNFIFEAKELKGENLVDWLISYSADNNKILSRENARLLLDIVGQNRSMLEAQLEKIFTYIGDESSISYEAITSMSTALKEYNIFNLQNAIGKKDKSAALKISYNMIDNGAEPTYIIHMLTRYFTGLSRVNELLEKKVPENVAARHVGTHPYFYKDYLRARRLFSERQLINAVQALLNADISVKTTSLDNKTIISLLISDILK